MFSDEKVNEEIAVWKEGVDEFGKEVLGKTRVLLDQRSCRRLECNLGDFVADSMVYAVSTLKGNSENNKH